MLIRAVVGLRRSGGAGLPLEVVERVARVPGEDRASGDGVEATEDQPRGVRRNLRTHVIVTWLPPPSAGVALMLQLLPGWA